MKVLADTIYFVAKDEHYAGIQGIEKPAIPIFVSAADAVIFMKTQSLQSCIEGLRVVSFELTNDENIQKFRGGLSDKHEYALYLGLCANKKNNVLKSFITTDRNNPWPAIVATSISKETLKDEGINLKPYFENEEDLEKLMKNKYLLNASNELSSELISSLCDEFIRLMLNKITYRKRLPKKTQAVRAIFGTKENMKTANYTFTPESIH